MTDYFVGIGGSDASNGLSWANRKLTLNGAEDVPVAAGDTVYVGPGTYRELLTVDVAGSGGSPITYIGDVSGEKTDGVGGIVRITGSDNDTTATRTKCINCSTKDFRTFRGFICDLTTEENVDCDESSSWILEDCHFGYSPTRAVTFNGTTISDHIIRRCVFTNCLDALLFLRASSVNTNTNILIENCIFWGAKGDAIKNDRIGDVLVKNCLFIGIGDDGVDVSTSAGTGAGEFTTVSNCILTGIDSNALEATVSGDIIEDYNSFYQNGTDRFLVSTGANSNTFPPLLSVPILLNGFVFPWNSLVLSDFSQLVAIAGTGEATDDFFGATRPTTSAKKSWGPVQYSDFERETTTTRGGSTASVKLADAGRHQIWVPVTNISTTIEVYVNREANYAGTNPQLVVKQPGVADDTTTDAGSSGSWNQLTTTLTPSANTDYVVVELVSNNTATSGSFAAYFDDLSVS